MNLSLGILRITISLLMFLFGSLFLISMSFAVDVKVWNFNMCNHCDHYPRRTETMAAHVANSDNLQSRMSDLFGFSEARNDPTTLPPQRQEPKKISCDGRKKMTPRCFGQHWLNKLNPPRTVPLITKQVGELAVLANGERFERVGSFIEKDILDRGTWGLGPPIKLLGVRLRIIGSGEIIPFYVTHLRGNKEMACKKIVDVVLNNWVDGDLPPIVVGDFNFSTPANPTAAAVMNNHFVEIGDIHQLPDIEHIWVGRANTFNNPGGSWFHVMGSYDSGDPLCDCVPCCARGPGCPCRFTDHNVPAVELSAVTPAETMASLGSLFTVPSVDQAQSALIVTLSPLFNMP